MKSQTKSRTKSPKRKSSKRSSRSSQKKENKPVGRMLGIKDRTGIFEMVNKEIKCKMCKNNLFKEQKLQLQQRWKNYWGEELGAEMGTGNILGLFNQRVCALRCCECSKLIWFNVEPILRKEVIIKECFESGY